jgi:4'-phosphopantetheinyl transferase
MPEVSDDAAHLDLDSGLTSEARQEHAIAQDEVRVWVAALDVGDDRLADLEADLSPDELERASRLGFEEDRRRFVAAHGFLRRVLAHHLGCVPKAVLFRAGANGKPELVRPGSSDRAGLRFNLAYSSNLAVCALALDREVGVDVERVREVPGLDLLASRVLSEREQEALRAWDSELAGQTFLTAWTLKEAVLKARGEGLGREPVDVEVSLEPAGTARLLAIAGEPGAERRWTLQALDAGPGYVAAVAAEGDGWFVRRQLSDAALEPRS